MEEYAFIDMHIHTEHSRKEPVRQTVKDLLEKLEVMAEEKGKPIAFSITDHESVLGCVEADQLLRANPEKYKMLRFIPGVEFSTSLKCLGVDEENLSLFKHCHMLGYGYDIHDPNLVNFSKIIYQRNCDPKNKGVTFQTGYAIIIAKNILEKETGKKIPFSKLGDVIRPDLDHSQVYDIFVNVMNRELGIKKRRIRRLIADFFAKDKSVKDDVLYNSKQSILDLIDMIHSAGGYVCIAHANSIKYKKPERYERIDGQRHYAFIDLVERVQALTGGRGIDAMELFHNENTDSMVFIKVQELAKKYNLYYTAGSDTHSPNINGNILSKCMARTFEKATLPPNTKYDKTNPNTKVVSLPFVDLLINGTKTTSKQDFVLENRYLGKMQKAEADGVIQKIVTRKKNSEASTTAIAEPTTTTLPAKEEEPSEKKFSTKKELKYELLDEEEFNLDDYAYAFSGKLKREYAKDREL